MMYNSDSVQGDGYLRLVLEPNIRQDLGKHYLEVRELLDLPFKPSHFVTNVSIDNTDKLYIYTTNVSVDIFMIHAHLNERKLASF